MMPPTTGFKIFLKEQNAWKEIAYVPAGLQFIAEHRDISQWVGFNTSVTLKLVAVGGKRAHVDSVAVSLSTPVAVRGTNDAVLDLAKMKAVDHDLVDVTGREVEVDFLLAGDGRAELFLLARIDDGTGSTVPFIFPPRVAQFYQVPVSKNSTGHNKKLICKEWCRCATGHPDGYTHIRVGNDAAYLYVHIDFTPDSTQDGNEDYATVTCRLPNRSLRTFKCTTEELRWGVPSFMYTDAVNYQHNVYEFKIPLHEMGIDPLRLPENFDLAFSAYGTAAPGGGGGGSYIWEGVPAERIDLAAFQSWADWCDNIAVGEVDENYVPVPSVSLECHIYFDQAFSVRRSLDMVSLNGRGTVVQMGAKFTAIVDRKETLPAQRFLFTMGNISKDSFQEEFLPMEDRANAVEVTFFDREMDYERQLIEIYSDDYDTTDREINKTSITLYGCTSRYQATDHARFLMNCNRYLTQMVAFDADVDAIACFPGDMIDVAHDVPEWGQSGRVVAAGATSATLDRLVNIEAGKDYLLGVQHLDDDTREEVGVTAAVGETDVLALSGDPWTKVPAAGAQYYFGELTRLTKAFRVLKISRTSDQRRKISCLEYLELVYSRATALMPFVPPALPSNAVIGLVATEVWSGGMVSSVSLSWRGSSLAWYVYQNTGTGLTLLGSTGGLNYTTPSLPYGVNYTFAVSPTPNPADSDAASVVVNVSGANLKIQVSDTVGLEDGNERLLAYSRRLLEYFEVEDYGGGGKYKIRISEAIGVEDSPATGLLPSTLAGNETGVEDSLSIEIMRSRKIADPLGVNDSRKAGI